MKAEIILEIDAKGRTLSVEVRGVSGRQCERTSRFIEDTLGEVVLRERKSEYFVERAGTRGRMRTNRSFRARPTGDAS
jgi:hypothetical protein